MLETPDVYSVLHHRQMEWPHRCSHWAVALRQKLSVVNALLTPSEASSPRHEVALVMSQGV